MGDIKPLNPIIGVSQLGNFFNVIKTHMPCTGLCGLVVDVLYARAGYRGRLSHLANPYAILTAAH